MFKLVNQLPLRGNNRSLSLPSGLTGSPLAPFLQMIGASHRFTRASHAGVASAWTRPDPLLPVRSSCSHLVLRRWHAAFTSYSNDYEAGQRLQPNTWLMWGTSPKICNDGIYNRKPSKIKIHLTPTSHRCEDKIRTILLSKNGTYCYMTTFTPYARDIAHFKKTLLYSTWL